MLNKLSTSVVFAALVSSSLIASAGSASGATTDCAEFDQPVHQVIRSTSDANLITISDTEASGATRFGFTTDLGEVGRVSARPEDGLTPVWRLYRSGDFAWAAEGARTQELVDRGYTKQFVAFYASATDSGCVAPVHQLERNGIHRIAAEDEVAGLVKDGWSQDKIAFYAVWGDAAPTPEPEPQAPAEPAEPAPTGDTKFTVAVIPDTQNESGASATRFANRVSWLVKNKSSLDLRYALQVGDLTNWGDADPAQFTKMGNEIKPLEAVVPWAGAVGNHDTGAVCVGGSACPGVSANVGVRDTSAFNATFPPSRFPRLGGTFEAGKTDNSYQTFSAGGVDWLVLTLELWPRAAAVQWAQGVVASHPDHNVIVQTHAYLESNGSISQSQGGYGSTSPQFLYDNLIKRYPNIKLVLSGHVGDAAVRTDTGVEGNKIVSMLQTFHSPTNPVRLVEIDTAAGTMTSRIYAPGTNTEYPQFSTSTSGIAFAR